MTKMFFCLIIFSTHIVLTHNLYNQGKIVSQKNDLKLIHLEAEKVIEKDLFDQCKSFQNAIIQNRLTDFFNSKNIGHDLVQEKVIDIKDLSFSKVIFRSYLKNKESIFHLTHGLLVSHKTSHKCFGII